MKQRHISIALLVIATLLLSVFTLSSCEAIGKIQGIFGDNGNNEKTPVTDDPGTPDDPGTSDDPGTPDDPKDPVVSEPNELPDDFYDASKWVYMTNNNGATLDGGDIPYSMDDGSIKFHQANQAYEIGDLTNATVSFMLKGTNDWSIWFNSSSIDNNNNSSYRLNYAYSGLRIALSSAPEQAAAVIDDSLYNKGEWNRFDIEFSTVDRVCQIKVYINGVRAALSAGDNTAPAVSVADNVLTHTQPAMFSTGNYIVVKVWYANNFVQLKPVAKADEKDVPIIACIGDSITNGAGATNFYTEAYPAQLQNALEGAYNVINFGLSGTTAAMRPNKEAWLDNDQWVGVQAIVPDIAILGLGTNDSKYAPSFDTFYADYKNIVDHLLKLNPEMKIIISTSPKAYSAGYGISDANIQSTIVPVQKKIAADYKLDLIDMYVISQNKASLFPDGIHPSTRGYSMFAKVYANAILNGVDALTEEFINEINEEYQSTVPNDYVELDSVVIDNMTLTIKGTSNDDGIQLFVGQDPSSSTVYNSYNPITLAEDGSFEIAFDLKSMPIGTGWYNVRIYFTDGNYHTVSLNDLKNAAGESIALWSYVILENTQIQISSWDEGGIPTLSFNVQEYVKPAFETVITGGSIEVEDDKILLTVTGTTTDPNAVLLVGVSDDPEVYGHALTIVDGSFTASVDLATLEAGIGWYNVKIIMSDGNMIAVPYDKLGVSVEDSFSTTEKVVTIKNWSAGDKLTSLLVEVPYILEGGKISATNMPFALTQEGDQVYINFSGKYIGNSSVERTIELILTTEDPVEQPTSLDSAKIVHIAENTYSGDATNEFVFKINATEVGKHNDWIRFVLKVTEGEEVSYYTLKPLVESHNDAWVACATPITINGVKYELAICLSSFFAQIIEG